ncbi:MAG: hypothetical protein JNM27_01160 [Leptospirales bacterium]|nr:hypothetical protein [Leptospirales bacterium]
MTRNIVLLGFVLMSLHGCKTYESAAIRTQKWPGDPIESMRDVGIGYFESSGTARTSHSQQNLYDSLAFALRELGYVTRETPAMFQALDRTGLPADRLLSDEEVLRLAGRAGVRLFLQGRLQEIKTETLLEDHLQIMLNVSVYDARIGEKIADIKVFGNDLDYNTGKQSLQLARLARNDLESLIVGRDAKVTRP